MLASLALALALTGAAAPQNVAADAVDPAIVQAPKRWPGVLPTDREITEQLNALVKQQPNLKVCIDLQLTSTRFTRHDCRTLQAWYDYEDSRDTNDRIAQFTGIPPIGGLSGPPYELLGLIKERYRNPEIRARALERERLRLAAAKRPVRSAIPPASNP